MLSTTHLCHSLNTSLCCGVAQVKNPQFVRDVVIVHFSHCNSLASIGRVSTVSSPCCVRNFKFTSPAKEHPQHLLTISMLDDVLPEAGAGVAGEVSVDSVKTSSSQAAAGRHGMTSYIMTESSLRTWGFPMPLLGLPLPVPSEASGLSASSSSDDERKKRKAADISSDFEPHLEVIPPSPAPVRLTDSCSSVSAGTEGVLPSLPPRGYLGGCVALPSLAAAVQLLDTPQGEQHSLGGVCSVLPPAAFHGNNEKTTESDMKCPLVFRQTTSAICATGTHCTGISEESDMSLDLRIIALDCEMCDTAHGPELTRISVVDYNGIILLDTLVKPYSPVVNYKEAFSGVNATLLDPVDIRIEQVQVALLRLVSSSTVLIGHSLENDLYALKLSHKCCVDTSVLYPHPIGFPHRHKLKYLAKEFLKINIQNASSTASGVGHSSVEDARVALQLVKLKVEHGPLFGVLKQGHQDCPREPLVAKIPEHVQSAFFFSEEDLLKRRRACVGYGVHCSSFADNDAAVDGAVQHLQQVSHRNNLLCDRNFTYLEISCKGDEGSNEEKTVSGSSKSDNGQVLPCGDFTYYSYVERIMECLSTHSNRDVLMLVSTQPSVQEVFELQNRKKACTKVMSASSWNTELDDLLERKKVLSSFSDVEMVVVPPSSSIEPLLP